MPGTAKQRALEAIEKLPEDVSLEEVMERLYFLSKVERGLEQADSGQIVSHEEAKRRLGR
jgi:predicted transcriptional regulator